jgi:hypothetical protein
MVAPNEFWLCLHDLAEAHDAEGFTFSDRTENIVEQFAKMAPVAQRAFLAELVRVEDDIRTLHPLVSAAAAEAKPRPATLRIAPNEGIA